MLDNETPLKRRIGILVVVTMAAFALVIAVTTVLTMPLMDPVYLLGPGLYPFVLSILLFIACCVVFLETWLGRHDNVNIRSLIDRVAMKKPAGLVILLVVSLIILPVLGYLITLSLFSFVEMTFLEQEKRKWWVNAIYALAVTGGVYALFTALSMTLPEPFWL
jgi:magnesium-transporting ATPase (P-type)